MKVLHNNQRYFLSALLALCAVFAPAQTRLLSNVRVSSETIRLSDLLPQSASANLRGLTENIDVGHAPQLGNMRVLQNGQIAEILKAHPEIGRLSIPEQIVVIREGYPLELSDVRQAVTAYLRETSGVTDFRDSALDWPRDMATQKARPALKVRSAHWDAGRQRLYLLVQCAPVGDCAEFLASFRPPESLIDKYQLKPGSSSNREATAAGGAPILISSGHKARLVLQSAGLQISLQVICLENGRENETIRVRESGTSRIFHAQVVNRDLLWSRLES